MDGKLSTFFVVDNLFNTLLSVRYGSVNNGYYSNQNADEGRTFRAGIRFQM
jgi:outer membrane receptor protein involved in Fe transport